MAQVINTNIMSLNAQRQLNKSQSVSNQAMERLSSGLRINSAKDDAAGLAISTGMQSQIRGLTQAVRNSNDGVSMTQTAEGSMDEMTNILQRMRELSVQSANDTNSAANREAIQQEVDQLHNELDRIASTTEFNGLKLLDGSASLSTLQIGANSGQTLSFSIPSVTTNDLGLNGNLNKEDLNSGRVSSADLGAGDFVINGIDIGGVDLEDDGSSAMALSIAVNAKSADTGVTASAYNVVQGDIASDSVTGITNGLTITIGNGSTTTLSATSSMDNLVSTINRDVQGVTASLGDAGELLLTNDTGENITIDSDSQSDLNAAGFSGTAADTGTTFAGYVALNSTTGGPINVAGDNTENAGFLISNGSGTLVSGEVFSDDTNGLTLEDAIQINGVTFIDSSATDVDSTIIAINKMTAQTGVTASLDDTGGIQYSSANGGKVEISSASDTQANRTIALEKMGMGNEMGGKVVDALSTNVSTMAGAMNTIDKVDEALAKISASRAGLGAIQNRLGSTISNLENVSQNLSASNSRIQDADFAAETSKMSKAQILQQAGTSMLSQANASAQSVLSLLG
ncbi:MAG: flagellin [Psychromonas sp.]